MRHLRAVLAIAILVLSVGAFAQSQKVQAGKSAPTAVPLPANLLLSSAEGQAKAQGKNVLVIFHASWCGWCKRLDAFMQDPQYKSIFDDNFVTVKLTVLESDDKKATENPGGLDEMNQLGGKDAGLPLFAILDPSGKMIINSVRPTNGADKGGNTGFPVEPPEIDHFLAMMQQGAPKITADQLNSMKSYLTAKAAELKSAGH